MADVSQRNAEFWDELCGTHMARQLGIRDASPGELARFDAAYLAFYPYLLGYFPREHVEGRPRRLHRLPPPHGRPVRRDPGGTARAASRRPARADGLQPPLAAPPHVRARLCAPPPRRPRGRREGALRARYDASEDGAAAPHTDFVTAAELRGLLHGLHEVRVERRNMQGLPIPHATAYSRSAMMALHVDRLLGLHLYATVRL